MGGGGGRGKEAGKTEPSAELTPLVSGKGGGGGGGGGGGTANISSSNSVCEDDAPALDEAPDKGILGPAVQQKTLNKEREKCKAVSFLNSSHSQTIMKEAKHTYR